ncbi:MAG TPA: hypothetical protein VK203_12620 [Nostocaceae cyanobacterium]|nr:hypothetical protein [Nostocaceae cyanobacterium]
MPTTMQLDEILQQIESLSLEQLLELKEKVKALIEKKSSSSGQIENSLEKIIALVDEWMADESGYDEENYPEIEAALKESKISI